ncbi:hypothetical protein HPB51_010600 [Rhipicephalus microplus]|uniref:Uncharacterized protein n=1 Tax=Rhipicephalus microplus TaxID=6941 RepID=A0A9J6EPA4_RHIMP|nr:hypothetical protein HPB51_010600 [Rhipicephalus microplus]
MYPVRAIKTPSVAFRVLSETKSIKKLRGTVVLVVWDDGQQPAEAKLLDFGTQRVMEQKHAQLAKAAVAMASSRTEEAPAETQREVNIGESTLVEKTLMDRLHNHCHGLPTKFARNLVRHLFAEEELKEKFDYEKGS